MILVIVLVLLVVASILFHFFSPWWFTPIASNWDTIDDTINITFWVTGIVFILVNLFVAYAVYKFRYQKSRKAAYQPENKKLELWLTGITSLGIAAMLAPGLFVWAKFIQVPDNAAIVEVVGKQWHWSYRFPGQDGKLGTVDSTLITQDNPFGLNPKDPAGWDDILVSQNELRLPKDRPVKFLLRSVDVLHNFAVPQFRVKMDLVPGMVSYFWATPTRTGTFEILCQELCGIAHHTMRGRVMVVEQLPFTEWLQGYPTFAQSQQIPKADLASGQQLFATCGGCHGAEGEGNSATNAPRLSGLADWYVARQLRFYQQGIRGVHPKDLYGQQMAPMAGILSGDAALRNVAAFIESLPEQLHPATITGDKSRGQIYYRNCAACHGQQGEGNFFMNAPRLAGLQDWYLKRQIINFKEGIRGSHTQDTYGQQMALMAKILKSDQAINDLLAYINALQSEDSTL